MRKLYGVADDIVHIDPERGKNSGCLGGTGRNASQRGENMKTSEPRTRKKKTGYLRKNDDCVVMTGVI